MKTIFAENEIPYKKFESIGFSQEMVDDLPEVVMNKLLSGNWTPLLPIRVDLGDGIKRTIQARLKLERRAEGGGYTYCSKKRNGGPGGFYA